MWLEIPLRTFNHKALNACSSSWFQVLQISVNPGINFVKETPEGNTCHPCLRRSGNERVAKRLKCVKESLPELGKAPGESSDLAPPRRKLGGEAVPGEEHPRGSLVALGKSSAQAHHPWYPWGSGSKTTSHLKLRLLPTLSSLWWRVSTWVQVLPPLTCLWPQQVLALTLLLCVKWLSRGFVLEFVRGSNEMIEAKRLGQVWPHRSFQNVVCSPHPFWIAPGAFRGPCIRSIFITPIIRLVPGRGHTQAVVLFTAILCLSST